MATEQLNAQIEKQWEAYEALSVEKHQIIESYSRPTEWMKDERYIQIGKEHKKIIGQINKLNGQIQDIKEAEIFSAKSWQQ